MSNLIEIKKRIASITSTIKVTNVMQMIATAKIAKIKSMINVADRYETTANDVLNLYLKNTRQATMMEGFFEKNDIDNNKEKKDKKNILFILFSSDKGTCGSINTNIFKFATEVIKECQAKGQGLTFYPVGKKAVKWLKTYGSVFNVKTYNFDNDIAYAEYCNSELLGKITNKLIQEYKEGCFDEISILAHKYKNIITSNVERKQLLPIKLEEQDDIIKKNNVNENFINIDDNAKTPLSIIEFFIRTQFYKVYVSNIASVVSSRMNAMDNATKNGKELIEELRIKYNKTRQANITAELSDIVSGAEALC